MGVIEPGDWRAHWITDPDLLRWSRPLLGYHSQNSETAEAVKWVQIDLGSVRSIEELRFHALRHTVPERLALVAGDRRLTYRELDERANRLAHHLEGAGIGPGDV